MPGETYKAAGVSTARGDAASEDAFKQLSRTFNKDVVVLDGLVALRADFSQMREPLLAFASDGVGTKLKYAFASGQHNSVGIDLVAMCVNDLARNNIRPLAHCLYRATGKIDQRAMHDVIEGVVEGCVQAGCVYPTGETAEMPGFYAPGEYDLAGLAVGVFEREEIITGQSIQEGDLVFGLASSGIHSNGFSLVRKLFPPEEVVNDASLLYQILKPTRIYVKSVLAVNSRFEIHGWAHITGGGIAGKLGKIIPEDLAARLDTTKWLVHDIFRRIQEAGKISDQEMRSTFNLGLGMIGVAPEGLARHIVNFLAQQGEAAYLIGEIVKSERGDRVVFF